MLDAGGLELGVEIEIGRACGVSLGVVSDLAVHPLAAPRLQPRSDGLARRLRGRTSALLGQPAQAGVDTGREGDVEVLHGCMAPFTSPAG
jgi:hypothetical protein